MSSRTVSRTIRPGSPREVSGNRIIGCHGRAPSCSPTKLILTACSSNTRSNNTDHWRAHTIATANKRMTRSTTRLVAPSPLPERSAPRFPECMPSRMRPGAKAVRGTCPNGRGSLVSGCWQALDGQGPHRWPFSSPGNRSGSPSDRSPRESQPVTDPTATLEAGERRPPWRETLTRCVVPPPLTPSSAAHCRPPAADRVARQPFLSQGPGWELWQACVDPVVGALEPCRGNAARLVGPLLG